MAKYEVFVAETDARNRAERKQGAYWTEIFETFEDADGYRKEVLDQEEKFNDHVGFVAITCTVLIVEDTDDVVRIPIKEIDL